MSAAKGTPPTQDELDHNAIQDSLDNLSEETAKFSVGVILGICAGALAILFLVFCILRTRKKRRMTPEQEAKNNRRLELSEQIKKQDIIIAQTELSNVRVQKIDNAIDKQANRAEQMVQAQAMAAGRFGQPMMPSPQAYGVPQTPMPQVQFVLSDTPMVMMDASGQPMRDQTGEPVIGFPLIDPRTRQTATDEFGQILFQQCSPQEVAYHKAKVAGQQPAQAYQAPIYDQNRMRRASNVHALGGRFGGRGDDFGDAEPQGVYGELKAPHAGRTVNFGNDQVHHF